METKKRINRQILFILGVVVTIAVPIVAQSCGAATPTTAASSTAGTISLKLKVNN